MGEFYQQQVISPVASRENQAYSIVTGVMTKQDLGTSKGVLFKIFDKDPCLFHKGVSPIPGYYQSLGHSWLNN